MQKFESGRSSDYDAFNQWFRSCTKEQIPYIIVKNKTKYSTVEWDYINLDSKYDKYLAGLGRSHRDHLIELVRKHGGTKTEFTASNLLLSADFVPKENAPRLAEDIFGLQKSYKPDPVLDL